jgi:transposase
MNYVGIDVAKLKHDVFVMNDKGEVLRNSFTVPNTTEGFKELLTTLNSLGTAQETKICFEATGHYSKNIATFLSVNHYEDLHRANPLLVKKYIGSLTNRNCKTDKIDAVMIAHYLLERSCSKYSEVELYEQLKNLSRLRDNKVRERSDALVEITNSLDILFPEFKGFFEGKLSNTAIFILKKYKTRERIGKLTTKDMEDIHNVSRIVPASKYVELKELAKLSVGNTDFSHSFALKLAIESYERLESQIDRIKAEIERIMKKVDSPVVSIPGISFNSAAAIIGEFKNLTSFDNPGQLLAYAGLEASRHQSGQEDFKGKMVKRGSPHLRYVLMNVAVTVKNYNPVFAEYFNKKVNEGKHYRVALNHVAKKLLRVIFFLVKNNVKFDSSKLV